MLTRWAIALQSYDCTVGHKPGRLDIIPDTLSRLFNFGHSKMRLPFVGTYPTILPYMDRSD